MTFSDILCQFPPLITKFVNLFVGAEKMVLLFLKLDWLQSPRWCNLKLLVLKFMGASQSGKREHIAVLFLCPTIYLFINLLCYFFFR